MRLREKADLHRHLDGAVRAESLWELGMERSVRFPAGDAETLKEALTWRVGYSLEDCLRTFDLVTAVLQDGPAIRRIAREVVEDAVADGCSRLEVRYAPSLSTRGGMSLEDVVDATLAGFEDAAQASGVRTGLILCCWRAMQTREASEIGDLAVAYAGRGVVGIDIVDVAGSEVAVDLSRFRDAYERVGRAGLGRTCHAGEIGGPESVRAAIQILGVDRIGHGVASTQDPSVVDLLKQRNITVEVCLSSNLLTGTVKRIEDHPFGPLYRAGIRVALCTDDPAMEDTTLSKEYEIAAGAFGLDEDDLDVLAANSVRATFSHL